MNSTEIISKVAIIPSYILEDDIRLYHKYVSELKDNSLVVDVGTGLGKSVVSMGLSNKHVHIYTFETGIFPLERGWATSLEEYRDFLLARFRHYKLDNISLFMEDILLHDFNHLKIDLFHVDGEVGVEEQILNYMLPYVKKGGIILARNTDRFSESGMAILLAHAEPIEQKGKIMVVRKI